MGWFLLLVVIGVVVYAYLQHSSSKSDESAESTGPAGKVKGPGEFRFDIVGESHYQQALTRIAGPKTEDGVDHLCLAELVLDDGNKYDDKAVRVEIEGQTVGHMTRENARQWRAELAKQGVSSARMFVEARIVGGWDRGGGDRGSYGVKLDLPLAD